MNLSPTIMTRWSCSGLKFPSPWCTKFAFLTMTLPITTPFGQLEYGKIVEIYTRFVIIDLIRTIRPAYGTSWPSHLCLRGVMDSTFCRPTCPLIYRCFCLGCHSALALPILFHARQSVSMRSYPYHSRLVLGSSNYNFFSNSALLYAFSSAQSSPICPELQMWKPWTC